MGVSLSAQVDCLENIFLQTKRKTSTAERMLTCFAINVSRSVIIFFCLHVWMSLMGPYSFGVFAFSSKRRTSSPIYLIKIDFCCYIRQKWIFFVFASLKSLSVVRIVYFPSRKNFSPIFLSRFSSESLEIITNETSVLISGFEEVVSSTMDQWGVNKGSECELRL